MRRKKYRQCRSVQSIIGATQKRHGSFDGYFVVSSIARSSYLRAPRSRHARHSPNASRRPANDPTHETFSMLRSLVASAAPDAPAT
jgi:hypothetical protein